MKFKLFTIALCTCCLLLSNAQVSNNIPRLVKNGKHVQLLVDNKPFLILGGELGNSSSSGHEYMRPIWPKLKQMNLNTIVAPVYWELIEPVEGKFDFSSLDTLIRSFQISSYSRFNIRSHLYARGWRCQTPAGPPTYEGIDYMGPKGIIISPDDSLT